ncbi:MAG TPA: ParB N-terminal domain-containing protein [Acidimicrobiales bacterium]|jgi:ParB-like chromosome segregation protein Spo0J
MMIEIASLHQGAIETQLDNADQVQIAHYVKHIDEADPILVYENPVDGERIVVNGYHRVHAAMRLGWTHINAVLKPGDQQDVLLYVDTNRGPADPLS